MGAGLDSKFSYEQKVNPRLLFGVGASPRWSAPGNQIGILVALMINDIELYRVNTWKYVDKTTISEIVPRGKQSTIKVAVADELAAHS